MNISIMSMSPANAAIAKRLNPNFDARDTSAAEIGRMMDAARAEAVDDARLIIRELLDEIQRIGDAGGYHASQGIEERAVAYLASIS